MAGPINETFTPDRLQAGDYPVVTEQVTLLSGENRARGTVLGKITASGKLKIVNSANVDGSQVPYGVLLEDCDASGSDKTCLVALSGEFNQAAMVFGGTDTYTTHKAALRDANIYIKAVSQ